jgi:dolichyl-phosphate-mannose-protein mannosyltransferase
MVGFIADHVTQSLRGRTRDIVFGLSYALVFGVFLFFKDIAFGIDYPARQLRGRKWLRTWNIYDD